MMKKKWVATALTLSLVAPTVVACTKSESQSKDTERVLRVAVTNDYGDEGDYFRQQFTEIFEYANQNIKIEFVPVVNDASMRYGYRQQQKEEKTPEPIVKLKEVMQGDNPPDIVMVELNELQELITDNLLQPLDPMITKDKFDTTDIAPIVMEGLKSVSPDGKLYAMSPTFSSSALVYNKKIFDEAGVPYPEDNMTWDQIFDLAGRVANKESSKRIFGFSFTSYSYPDFMNNMSIYTAPLGLSMFDKETEKLTVDSDQWEKVWTTLSRLEKEKIIPSQLDFNDEEFMKSRNSNEENPFGGDDFLSGRTAMALMSYGELSRIDNVNKNADSFKNFTAVDYNVVTAPSHPEHPGVVANVSMNGIMGINAKAGNTNDAWAFLKFINGKDWARAKANNNYQLLSRKSYIKQREGSDLNMDAFLSVKPAIESSMEMYKLYRKYPRIWSLYDLGQNEFMQALQGNKSIRDALKAWQTEGDSMMQQMKDNPDGPLNMSGAVRAW